MARNTFVLLSFLAVLAALVIGVNMGKRFAPEAPIPVPTAAPLTPTPAQILTTIYTSTPCGIAFEIPQNFIKQETPTSTSAIFINPDKPTETLIFTCQKDIPRPPLTQDKIETLTMGSISAKLYHDASPKDGTPIDKFIFRHPKTGIDLFLAGIGETFELLLTSIKLLP